MAERVREADLDAKDRNKEQEELDELKNKIFSGEFENPTQEYEKAKKEHDKLYKPQILINVNLETTQKKEREQKRLKEKKLIVEKRRFMQDALINEEKLHEVSKAESIESTSNDDCASRPDSVSNVGSQYSRQGSESRDFMSNHQESDSVLQSPLQSFGKVNTQNVTTNSPPISTSFISLNLGANAKKKKIETTGVFINDEDNDDSCNPKKRKLVPLGKKFYTTH